MKLIDLVGEHVLEIVPMDISHPTDASASGIMFTLDDVTYLVFENPSDGYRSSVGVVLSFNGDAYELGGDKWPTNIREPVICSHRTNYEHGGESDMLEMRSKETGALIFSIGTENTDDYYPYYRSEWSPEELSGNAKERLND